MPRDRRDDGFTLIELMVTMTCMIVLAAIALPKLQGYILSTRLNAAKPYLNEIAAKERMYKIETGRYCCTAYTNFDENTLTNALGLSLVDAGDFCFVFICQSATLCENPESTPSFIVPATGPNAPDFEVWAILRNPTGTPPNVTGPGSTSCTPVAGKASPTGWEQPSGSTSAGRAGQVVALRYPPPANGIASSQGTYHAVNFDWHDGITESDALQP
ncbi:MAG: prepilin-type N-terminal cleavage/methylation domain-containing protein [Acidisphaera sp.]|nr:prepilin-type N-terminal cleavage/methylation domain-containing protein [Acidisphaera sp.]